MQRSADLDTDYVNHLEGLLRCVRVACAGRQLDALVIHAGLRHDVFLDDTHYPFRVNPWFAWVAPGLEAPDSLILIRNNHKPQIIFVSPEDYWHTPPAIPSAAWTQQFDWVPAPDAVQACTALPPLPTRTAWLGEPAPPNRAWAHNPKELLDELEQGRTRKSPYEVACMREASRLGADGHLAAERAFRAGASEFDIHLAFLAATRQDETALPYGSIVALNSHAATLHYQLRDRTAPVDSHSLLIDAGASCRGYASDITRTWAARPGLFADLVAGMHALQQQLCAAVKPGVDWKDLHLEAHRLIAELLHRSGVVHMAPEQAVTRGLSSTFLPHGLGHLLGLQVHDVGGFHPAAGAAPIARPEGHPALRLTRPLVPGMVVTVEPGLYFIDSLLQRLKAGPLASAVNWALVESLAPCGGIRIEDNVLVTPTGHENLTRAAFAACA